MSFFSAIRGYLNQRPTFKQFIKFCFVGSAAAVIHFFILYSLTEWLNFWYLYSNALGFMVSVTFNFFSNKFWTFRSKEWGTAAFSQLLKFIVVLVSGLLITTGIIYALTEWLYLDYRWSWVIATGAVTFWNYLINRFWTFKVKNSSALIKSR
ncbi:MAG: hypothetical protein A2744_02305 [Candidatus Buchananbacteria bacterium RIFCSPHIGHO2_01_FULL_44_11]|uniref:GtrA/DPMS transmembrane domain-containing protein n=1 Tax=Candidatus Buchananbacteria bacterium RIFCSPHIGHO2_01_FULL_44_11 TaxID=1797535 RepID=A0A1G1XZN7_9BACT|nr:MAG: hypothetical protein A2744_02305 [Candidatus Buchananbacteria bacterium RIFCSPHIGHO2_01_FULL_44_11]